MVFFKTSFFFILSILTCGNSLVVQKGTSSNGKNKNGGRLTKAKQAKEDDTSKTESFAPTTSPAQRNPPSLRQKLNASKAKQAKESKTSKSKPSAAVTNSNAEDTFDVRPSSAASNEIDSSNTSWIVLDTQVQDFSSDTDNSFSQSSLLSFETDITIGEDGRAKAFASNDASVSAKPEPPAPVPVINPVVKPVPIPAPFPLLVPAPSKKPSISEPCDALYSNVPSENCLVHLQARCTFSSPTFINMEDCKTIVARLAGDIRLDFGWSYYLRKCNSWDTNNYVEEQFKFSDCIPTMVRLQSGKYYDNSRNYITLGEKVLYMNDWLNEKLNGVYALLADDASQEFQNTPKGDFCWMDSYGRGAGSLPEGCPNGRERIDLLCYSPCPSGYTRFGYDCHQHCPEGLDNNGLFCRKSEYGRGAGFWDLFSKWEDCEHHHGKGNCEWQGWLVYPKCKDGYSPFGCCICRPHAFDCNQLGMGFQLDLSCAKKTIIGDPVPRSCTGSLQYDFGLCYTPCGQGYTNIGPVCWGKGPANWVLCGAGYAINQETCGRVLTGQVFSVLNSAFSLVTLGAGNMAGYSAAFQQFQNQLSKVKNSAFFATIKVGGKAFTAANIILMQKSEAEAQKETVVRLAMAYISMLVTKIYVKIYVFPIG